MSIEPAEQVINALLRVFKKQPLERLDETEDGWQLATFAISKHRPSYSDGWSHNLRPESRLYKRWIDYPDICVRGWLIMLHVFDPVEGGPKECEAFVGWVPAEREHDADRWIAHLNTEIRNRLVLPRGPS